MPYTATSSHLLPDDAALSVVDVVHLVEYDPLNVANDVGALVEHAAQDLGGHNQAWRLGLDADVARQQAHLLSDHGVWLCNVRPACGQTAESDSGTPGQHVVGLQCPAPRLGICQ